MPLDQYTKYTQLPHNCIKNRGYIVVIKRKEKEIKKKIKIHLKYTKASERSVFYVRRR